MSNSLILPVTVLSTHHNFAYAQPQSGVPLRDVISMSISDI